MLSRYAYYNNPRLDSSYPYVFRCLHRYRYAHNTSPNEVRHSIATTCRRTSIAEWVRRSLFLVGIIIIVEVRTRQIVVKQPVPVRAEYFEATTARSRKYSEIPLASNNEFLVAAFGFVVPSVGSVSDTMIWILVILVTSDTYILAAHLFTIIIYSQKAEQYTGIYAIRRLYSITLFHFYLLAVHNRVRSIYV